MKGTVKEYQKELDWIWKEYENQGDLWKN
jgi:hypothetical protein